jgi:5-(carboxyamino)imidazole ribonucleotide synthase
VITLEFENVPVEAVERLAALRPVCPARRRWPWRRTGFWRSVFSTAGARHRALRGGQRRVLARRRDPVEIGAPAILKTRRLGYDGKGQVLEQKIDFAFEVSILVARAANGTLAFYDIPRNEHRGGILRRSTVTDEIVAPQVAAEARVIAQRIAEALDYVGVLAVELFVEAEGQDPALRVNEIAPRVHNSGHWTMDACNTDQFENHIRAICRWPLGPTTRRQDIEMVNLIGDDVLRWPEIAADGEAKLHLYGKDEAREGRKMGHVNRVIPRAGSA